MHRLPAAAAALLAAAIYLLRLDSVAGLIVDDGWYVLLAQALASGAGYTMINAPVAGLMPIDPPAFPAVLSLLVGISSRFPDNVMLLKSVSVAAMFAIGPVAYWYFRRARGVETERAAALAVATVLTPALVFLATSAVMSECLFTLALLGGTIFVDRAVTVEPSRVAGPDLMIAAGLSAVTVLLRSAGVALPAAAVLYLAYRRRWTQALVFALLVGACLAPWQWYSRTHRPSEEQQLAHGGAHAMTYRETFWQRWAGDRASGTIGVGELPARVFENAIDVFGRAVGGVMAPAIFRGPSESGQEIVALGGARGFRAGSMGGAPGAMAISFGLSVLVAAGYVVSWRRRPGVAEVLLPVSLAIVLLWPHWTFRFVLPLAPFLFYYAAGGAELLGRRVSRLFVLVLVALSLLEHGQYIALKLSSPSAVDWIADAAEIDEVLDWVAANVPHTAVLATTNPPLMHLRTGRRTVAIDDPRGNWHRWQQLGVGYLVALRPSDLPDPGLGYEVVHRSGRRDLWVLAIRK